jgi:hypothetical protein
MINLSISRYKTLISLFVAVVVVAVAVVLVIELVPDVDVGVGVVDDGTILLGLVVVVVVVAAAAVSTAFSALAAAATIVWVNVLHTRNKRISSYDEELLLVVPVEAAKVLPVTTVDLAEVDVVVSVVPVVGAGVVGRTTPFGDNDDDIDNDNDIGVINVVDCGIVPDMN